MTPEELNRRAAYDFEVGADRFERASAANAILIGLGVPDASVEEVARLMRWADTYAQAGREEMIKRGWTKS